MPFSIIRNDITSVTADAIVNTANPRPVIGAGTDSAIHAKAGPKLLEERKKIGNIAPGYSAATPAFGLNAKYVLHTVSPVWEDGQHREPELLRKAYDSALHLAAELKCQSVAFPLMAAGAYRFPKELALQTAIDAFTDFLMTNDMEIILVLLNERAFELAGDLFADLESYVDKNYASEPSRIEYDAIVENFSAAERPETEYDARIDLDEDVSSPEWHSAKPDESRRFRLKLFSKSAWEKLRPSSHAPKAAKKPASLWESDSISPCASAPEAVKKPTSSWKPDEIRFPHAPTFSERLQEYLMKHEGKDSAIYGDGAMSRQLFNKIINSKDYTPKKSTVIQLAVGLHLTLEQTQELLGSAGYILTHSDKRDVVVEYYIEHRIYKVVEIDIALEKYGLACLGKY